MGDNPHDRTDPYVSAAIVTAHTRDGLALAQKYHLPPEIQTIIMEHHGDTPVMYFYHKALQMADGKPVDIADFRYDGQRPTTKESAIVMLADTIEAFQMITRGDVDHIAEQAFFNVGGMDDVMANWSKIQKDN